MKLPAGAKGPLIASVFWLAGKWGPTRFDTMDSLGLQAVSKPFRPARQVGVEVRFDLSMALPGA